MAPPERRGRPVCLTLTHSAYAELKALFPGEKGLGHFVSSLIHAEVVRRETRREEREKIAAQLVDETGVDAVLTAV
jgi:hypothetical protein